MLYRPEDSHHQHCAQTSRNARKDYEKPEARRKVDQTRWDVCLFDSALLGTHRVILSATSALRGVRPDQARQQIVIEDRWPTRSGRNTVGTRRRGVCGRPRALTELAIKITTWLKPVRNTDFLESGRRGMRRKSV